MKFNIHNLHYATKTVDESGKVGYLTPKKIPGAVAITLEAQGELTPFYADGIKFYVTSSNAGYEGDLEVALIPDEFRQEILGEELDANKVMFENANNESEEFALGFEIDGDKKGTLFWFFNCTATRPTTESKTNEQSKEPVTDKIKVSCAASEDGMVRAKTTAETTGDVEKKWFEKVYEKVEDTV